ncbi:MAG: transporter substrate-binding domain-containing protein [Oscillospiraceae bacterium]
MFFSIKKAFLSSILIISLLFSLSINTFATNNRTILKVAFYPMEGFFEYDENGKECGYGVDYLDQISRYTGIEFKYIYIKDWEKCEPYLDDGKVDLVLPAEVDPTKPKNPQYLDESIMDTYHAVMTLKSRNDIYYDDTSALRKLKIAVPAYCMRFQYLLDFFEENFESENVIEYETYNECETAMRDNEVDLVIASIIDSKKDMKTIKRFGALNNYIKMRVADPYYDKINDSLLTIHLNMPSFKSDLFAKYYNRLNILPYTQKEVNYINKNSIIRVATYSDRVPLSYYDNTTHKFSGIIVDTFKLLEDKTGLKFEFVSMPKSVTPIEGLAATDADLVIPCLERKYYNNTDVFISEPFLNFNIAFAGTKNGQIKKVGVAKYNANMVNIFKNATSEYEFTFLDSSEDCLAALKKAEVDAIISDTSTLSYLMQNPVQNKLKILPAHMYQSRYCIGANEESDVELLSIINKGISRITLEEKDTILNFYLTTKYKMSFWDYIYSQRVFVVSIFLFVFAVMIYIGQREMFLKELKLKNREVEHSYKVKSDFLSRMSHEIRTPMNAIIGLSTLGLDAAINPEATDYFSKIKSSANYLLALLNDILDMSKIEKNKLTLTPVNVNIRCLFDEINTILTSQIKEKKIEYVFTIMENEFAFAKFDKMRVQQIVINLVNNAIKFSNYGGKVECEVQIKSISEKTLLLTIVVRDNGVGMSEKFLGKLFKPFEQEKNKYSNCQNGTGLGLSIVNNIVKMMNGTITVTSEIDKGSEFTVTVEVERVSGEITEDVKPLMMSEHENLRGKVILLAEDNELNAQIAKKLLENKGVIIVHVEDGEKAVATFNSQANNFDAILMDIRMPVLDGFEASAKIRSSNKANSKTIPIIAMTADDYKDYADTYEQCGINYHIAKPIDPKIMFETLSYYL